jgi:hypothetical protein
MIYTHDTWTICHDDDSGVHFRDGAYIKTAMLPTFPSCTEDVQASGYSRSIASRIESTNFFTPTVMSEQARAIISEVSGHDLDQWLRPSTFTNELEEVNPCPLKDPRLLSFHFHSGNPRLIFHSLLEAIFMKN